MRIDEDTYTHIRRDDSKTQIYSTINKVTITHIRCTHIHAYKYAIVQIYTYKQVYNHAHMQ